MADGARNPIADYVGPNLIDGKGTLTFDLPSNAKVGESVEVEFTVHDPVTGNQFPNRAKMPVLAAVDSHSGPKQKPKPKPDQPPGKDAEGSAGINFPEVFWIEQKAQSWDTHFSKLDDCLHVLDEGEEKEGKYEPAYKFYLNADNKALKNELVFTKLSPEVVKKQFEIGVALIAMALIHDDQQRRAGTKKSGNDSTLDLSDDDSTVERRAFELTRAIAPVIIPMIQSLGDLAEEAADLSDLVGHAA